MKHVLLWGLLLLTSNILFAQGWGQTQKIVSADRSIADQFGWSVAIDGDYAVIGARGGGPAGVFRGTAYVFQKDMNGVWIEIDQLTNIDNANFDEYGHSIAISGDYIFVGAIGQDYMGNGTGNFLSAAGAVYVYENDGSGNWNEIQKLVASDRDTENRFGHSLGVRGDYAVIGTYKQDYDATGSNFRDDAGAAYIFERDANGVWNEVQKIVASDRAAFDYFGRYGITIDSNVLVVGAHTEDEDISGTNTVSSAGSAYVFERDGSGTWNEVQKIVASDREQGEWFGKSIGIIGNTIIVGAEQEYSTGNTSAAYGVVYVFENDGNGVWYEVQKISPSYLEHQSKFGQSVAFDGAHIIVGAFRADIGNVPDGGAAFMFEKDGSGVWNQVAVMYEVDSNTADNFGFDVAICGDNAIVGAYQEDENEFGINTLGDSGSAYIFNVNEPNTLDPLETLSILDNDLEYEVRAYPNPVINSLNIELGKEFNELFITVTNLLGQQVFVQNFNNVQSIDLPFNFEAGLYLVEVKLNNNTRSVFKIIKR